MDHNHMILRTLTHTLTDCFPHHSITPARGIVLTQESVPRGFHWACTVCYIICGKENQLFVPTKVRTDEPSPGRARTAPRQEVFVCSAQMSESGGDLRSALCLCMLAAGMMPHRNSQLGLQHNIQHCTRLQDCILNAAAAAGKGARESTLHGQSNRQQLGGGGICLYHWNCTYI